MEHSISQCIRQHVCIALQTYITFNLLLDLSIQSVNYAIKTCSSLSMKSLERHIDVDRHGFVMGIMGGSSNGYR
jgi:hypothetical protein